MQDWHRCNLLAGLLNPAQNSLHGPQELLDGIRLDQNGVGLEHGMPGKLLYGQLSGCHDNRGCLPGRMQFFKQFKSCHFGHFVVSDQQVIMLTLKGVPSNCSIFGSIHMTAQFNQDFGIKSAGIAIVLHHQDSMERAGSSLRCCAG